MISTIGKGAIIEIGDNCGFSGTVIGAALHIKLGNNVRCGANTLITDSDWHTDDYRTGKDKEVIIEDNVWLGYGVKVLKGVHIGNNSLIGANSVVTKDIPANVIAAGNPCKVIKQIEPQE
jgi:acetyltransferase-like isoleucine patch superfamily enzyme